MSLNENKSILSLTLTMDKYYVKQYIPGYTGHIQQKNSTFGITAGEINRQLVLKQCPQEIVPKEHLFYAKSQAELPCSDGDKAKYGYRSRHGISWISGPTHQVSAQHIPRKN